MPKVSVIIPVYNTEKYLRECLNSVVNQTLKDIEIICVDDGSIDNSLNISKEYAQNDSRIKILTQKNKGAAAARNKGMYAATGEYLYFIDSDDYLQLDAFEKIYKKFTETNAEICVFKNSVYHQSTGVLAPCNWEKYVLNVPEKVTFNKYDIPNLFFQFCNIPAWSKMYKTSFVKNNKIEFQNLKTCNDVYFNYITLVKADAITFLDETLLTWRTGHSCTTNTRGNHIGCTLKAYKAIKNELDKKEFQLLSDTFYNRVRESFDYEISKVSVGSKKDYWMLKLYKFLPKKYWTNNAIELKKRNSFIKKIFSIQNVGIHKVLCVLGIKLKIKRKSLKKIKNENKVLNFRTLQNLSDLIRDKISILPDDIDLIVGIPRSGVIPAYLIALFLNKKVCTINEFINNLEPLNGYTRPVSETENKSQKQKVLVVDDSIYSGKSMDDARALISKHKDLNIYDIQYCAIYALEQSKGKVDYYFDIVPSPRMFQWNYLNHSNAKVSCFDMDGVLCVDPTAEQNDDGEKYIDFILNAKPLYIPSFKINSIVTSRLEKYRPQTEQWLKEHNVQYDNLYMLNLKSAKERQESNCHAEFKAKIYLQKENCNYFIESNRAQAKKIAQLTGKQVICVTTDEYFCG